MTKRVFGRQPFLLATLIVLMTMVVGLMISDSAYASPSSVHTVNYQTTYKGKTYSKQALVYLPANYSSKRRYDTIYLLHGSTETARDFFNDGRFHSTLDRLIASGQLKPAIVVFPTYYPNRRFVTSDYYRDNRLNKAFAQHELVHDLVPAVEGRYHTYAHGTSQAALQASRNHRTFGGFSMGAITTWYVFQYQLPYFATYLPVAGDSWTVESDGGGSAPKRTAARLGQTVADHPQLSFKIMAAVGSADGTDASMNPQIRAMHNLPSFNESNLQYYHVPGGTHSPTTVRRAFVHFAQSIN